MSEISEIEIKSMTKEQNYMCGYENGKSDVLDKVRAEIEERKLHCWYECDCEHCPSSWEDRSYEGECNDCGCILAKKGHDNAPMLICMLPRWIKKILLKHKAEGSDKE